jgi:PhnB protein
MPYLRVREASRAIAFYAKAFGAKERSRLMMPDGRIGHAELIVSGTCVMLSDEFPEMQIVGPQALGGTSVGLSFYVADVDRAFAKAIAAGATELRAVADQFFGDRSGQLLDPFGHLWSLQQRIEEVTVKEQQKRLDASMQSPPKPTKKARRKA